MCAVEKWKILHAELVSRPSGSANERSPEDAFSSIPSRVRLMSSMFFGGFTGREALRSFVAPLRRSRVEEIRPAKRAEAKRSHDFSTSRRIRERSIHPNSVSFRDRVNRRVVTHGSRFVARSSSRRFGRRDRRSEPSARLCDGTMDGYANATLHTRMPFVRFRRHPRRRTPEAWLERRRFVGASPRRVPPSTDRRCRSRRPVVMPCSSPGRGLRGSSRSSKTLRGRRSSPNRLRCIRLDRGRRGSRS